MAKYVTFENNVAPAYDGVYQRQVHNGKGHVWQWARYQHGLWFVMSGDYRSARDTSITSHYQTDSKSTVSYLRWRGLAQKPDNM